MNTISIIYNATTRPDARPNPHMRLLRAALLLICMLAAPAVHAMNPAVVTVPWLGDPNQPHQVYSGGSVFLQGVFVDTDTYDGLCYTSATWDPGDGSGPLPASGNALALERTHTYSGADGQPFTATLSVTECGTGTVYTDIMRVVVLAKTRDVEVNMTIDKGLWYLHKTIQRTTIEGKPAGRWYGYSGTSYEDGETASVVQAFEIQGHREVGDRTEDPYVDTVNRGLRWIIGRLRPFSIGNVPLGDPDTNGNGIGIDVPQSSHPTYQGGQIVDAIVASGTPDAVADAGDDTWVEGRSYKDIVQDMMDAYSWGQAENSGGGWIYGWNQFPIDSSASQWWAIGGLAAEVWGVPIPDWVKDENLNAGVYGRLQIFNGSNSGSDGFCGYRNTGSGCAGTPSCLVMMTMDGVAKDDPRYVASENYLQRNFNSGLTGCLSHYYLYSRFAVAKALRLAIDSTGSNSPIELLGGTIDWYDVYARDIIEGQAANGSITRNTSNVWAPWVRDKLSTAWSIIILSPTVFELGPVASCTSNPPIDGTLALGGSATFDGSGSSHLDPEGEIVSYEWDFQDGDTAAGVSVSHSFESPGIYNVELMVTDANDLTDSTTCPIDVRAERIPPFADTGGPYQICLGDNLILDGSGSRDLDTEIVSWEWDWSGQIGDFSPMADATGPTPDATGVFNSVNVFDVALRVTDDDEFSSEDGQSPGPNSSTAFTTVTVIPADDPSCNQPPVAVCMDQEVAANGNCQGNASVNDGSYDPDGPDDIQSIIEAPGSPYELGSTTVGLTITDQRGESDSCQANVSVIDNTPPTVACPAAIQLEAEAGCMVEVPQTWSTPDDNCSIASVDQFPAAGAVILLGDTEVTVTATDGSGNVSEVCTTTITVFDPDEDGVCGTDDVCAGTVIPEGVPTKKHGTNRWSLEEIGGSFDDDPFSFDTVGPNGSKRAYSTTDTGGCSCEQIIETCGYGKGHTKSGCSNSVMDWWTGLYDQAGEAQYQCH